MLSTFFAVPVCFTDVLVRGAYVTIYVTRRFLAGQLSMRDACSIRR